MDDADCRTEYRLLTGMKRIRDGLAELTLPNGVKLNFTIPAGMDDAIARAAVFVKVKDSTGIVQAVKVTSVYVGSQSTDWFRLDLSQAWISQ